MSAGDGQQPLLSMSLPKYSYEDTFAALDANGPFTVLDLKDEDTSWALRSGPTSPVTATWSSAQDSASTRASDVSERDNMWTKLEPASVLDIRPQDFSEYTSWPPESSDWDHLVSGAGTLKKDTNTIAASPSDLLNTGWDSNIPNPSFHKGLGDQTSPCFSNLKRYRYHDDSAGIAPPQPLSANLHAIQPSSCATVIYTTEINDFVVQCASRQCLGMTFRRQADFKRHYQSTHAPKRTMFWCSVLNCPRSEGQRPFPRKDKIMDHIQKVHGGRAGILEKEMNVSRLSSDVNLLARDKASLTNLEAQAQTAMVRFEPSPQTEPHELSNNVRAAYTTAVMHLQDCDIHYVQTEPSDSEFTHSRGYTTSSEQETESSPEDCKDDYLLDIEIQRDRILDRLMVRVHEMFTSTGSLTFRGHAIAESQDTSKNEAPPPSTGKGAKKRRTLDERNDSSGHGSDNDDDISKRRKIRTENTCVAEPSDRKLACPYFKHNPSRHRSSRACSGPGWDTIHRIK